MLIKLYEDNPNPAEIRRIAGILRNGGIIILPTDTVYAFGCDIFNGAGVEFIAKIKNHDLRRSNLSFICHQLSEVSEYAKMDDTAFMLMKKNLPGPFTFILNGSSKLPKLFKNKKTVGIRMPKNNIALEIVRELGNPMMTSSIFTDEDTTEFWDASLAYAGKRWGSAASSTGDSATWNTTDAGIVTMRKAGKNVLWMFTPDAETRDTILEKLGTFGN